MDKTISFSSTIAPILILACIMAVPITLTAQERSERDASHSSAQRDTTSRPALNEQERSGEALFLQNCPLCHVPSTQKRTLGIQGPVLRGLYGSDADTSLLREFIQRGVPGKMPSFRYDLEPKQIDDIIAYLKTGAYAKGSGLKNESKD